MGKVLGAIGGGLVGGITGAIKKPGIGGPGGLEREATQSISQQFGSLQDLVGAGPGRQDVLSGVQSQRDLASLLSQLQESGGLPSQADIGRTSDIAGDLFGARRLGLQQAFEAQGQAASRRAAISGRSGTDPVLANQLAQSQIRQESLLGAEQQSFGSQLALGLAGQRLGFATQRAQVLGGLGQQAFGNRQSLLGLGQAIQQSERDFRVRRQQVEASRGGGLGGFLKGGIAGAGAGLSSAAAFSNFDNQQAESKARIGAFNRFGRSQSNVRSGLVQQAPQGIPEFLQRPTGVSDPQFDDVQTIRPRTVDPGIDNIISNIARGPL